MIKLVGLFNPLIFEPQNARPRTEETFASETAEELEVAKSKCQEAQPQQEWQERPRGQDRPLWKSKGTPPRPGLKKAMMGG